MAILPDKRMTATVTLTARSGTASADVLLDTGAELSALPNHALSPALKGASLGPTVTYVAAGSTISTVVMHGPTAQVPIEPHGGGTAAVASISAGVPVHFLAAGSAPFVTFDGIFGIDLLDQFAADPVKDLGATRNYLAKRA